MDTIIKEWYTKYCKVILGIMENDQWIGKAIGGIIVVVIIAAIAWALSADNSSAPATPEAVEAELNVAEDDLTIGPDDAPVTLVKFSDFQCPACTSMNGILNEVLDDYEGDIQYVYKHFPLRQIHEYADVSAQASEAADEFDKFSEMKNTLFENQSEWSELESQEEVKDQFISYAEDLDIDPEEFQEEMEKDEVQDKINEDRDLGNDLGVSGTPTLFINGEQVEVNTFSDLQDRIDSELEAGEEESEEETGEGSEEDSEEEETPEEDDS